MTLQETVEKYRVLAGDFGRPVPLTDFGLPRLETERLFSLFDEDYHISRFFHFSLDTTPERSAEHIYRINDFTQSHVSLDQEITGIL